jgi:hypothetical protein
MSKDWIGNKKSTFVTLGASSHSDNERQREDYYATEPKAVEELLKIETFCDSILEPACGEGHISEVLKRNGYHVVSRDLVDRGYGDVANFLSIDNMLWDGDVITNPPYRYAQEFVEKALQIVPKGRKIAMFLRLQFLEGKKRKELFMRTPPKTVWVSSSRLKCAINGDFAQAGSSAAAYAWFIWEKGYRGSTTVKWFN